MNRTSILAVLLSCFFFLAGCNQSKPVPNTSVVSSQDIDNSEYELVNKQLLVQGIGESRNQQQASSKSRSVALDSAVTILREVVMSIAEERGFSLSPIEGLDFAGTKTMNQRTTTFNNDKGVRMYRSYQTLGIDLETPLRALYEHLGVGSGYSWYMFLRDVDRHLNLKKAQYHEED